MSINSAINFIDDEKSKKIRFYYVQDGKKKRCEKSYEKSTKEEAIEHLKNKAISLNLFENDETTSSLSLSLNENQLKFVNSPIETSIVLGNPGCGKTRTIIEYCINKYRNNLISGASSFIILSFSKKAQLDFVARGKKSSVPTLFTQKNIRTLHSLAALIAKTVYLKSSSSVNTIILTTYKNMCNEHQPFKIDTVPELADCKFIIVDEAQDISQNQYNFICCLANKLAVPLIMVGDPNQNIFQFQGGSDQFLVNHSKNVYFLTHNYRSSNEIVSFCNYLRPHNYLAKMVAANNISHTKPIIYHDSIVKILQNIIEEVTNNECEPEEIAIIGPVRISNETPENKYLSVGLQLICNNLAKHGIKFVKYFNEGDGDTKDNDKNAKIEKGHVNIFTCHGSKGLEFKKVLVINYHFTTNTRIPTESDYNKFRYLWYVTLSRAIDKMVIYVDNTKKIFPEIYAVPNFLYTVKGTPLLEYDKDRYHFQNEKREKSFTVTQLLNDNNYFNETTFVEFGMKFRYLLKKDRMYEVDGSEVHEYSKYAMLYGQYTEELFKYYFYKNSGRLKELVDEEINRKVTNMILLDNENSSVYQNLLKKNIISENNNIFVDQIVKSQLTPHEYDMIMKWRDMLGNSNIITVYMISELIYYDNEYIMTLYKELLEPAGRRGEQVLFEIILYYYQIDNECKYILKFDFTKHLASISRYYEKIESVANKYIDERRDFIFQKIVRHKNIDIVGAIDILDGNKIIENKFVGTITEKHVIQVLLYYNCLYQNWGPTQELEIWNFKDGFCYTIIFDDKITNWQLNTFLCDIIKVKMTKNIFIMDLETNTKIPATTTTHDIFNNDPANHEIIDRYIYEYNFDYCYSEGLIKNQYPLQTTHITGITQSDLRDADDFKVFVDEMRILFSYCEEPIFIAHNGMRFDFNIMCHYDLMNLKGIKALDTLHLFRLFIKDTNVSNKLIDSYNYLFDTNMTQTHRAKGDTMLIVDILKKVNLTADELVEMTKS